MSARSFARAFREDTGRTPGEFVLSARLQGACRLLEETGLAPKVIAGRCGLGSVASMRRVFLRRLGVSPLQYREKFASEQPRRVQQEGLPGHVRGKPLPTPRPALGRSTPPGDRHAGRRAQSRLPQR